MLQGKRFIIHGISRLAVRVARTLAASNAEVTVLRRPSDGDEFIRMLPPGARVLETNADEDVRRLVEAGAARADCLLALGDDDLDNLRAAVAAHTAAPELPVVLRTFDPGLADQLEQGLNIRRAYSMSALAAPAFIAAACGDEVLETLRLGDGEAPICRLVVRPGSPFIGRTTAQVKTRFGCGVLARATEANDWQPVLGDGMDAPIGEGEQILVGGPLSQVLHVICRNAGWLGDGKRRRKRRAVRPAPRTPSLQRRTLLPAVAALLSAVLVISITVFSYALHLRPIDALYFVITTVNGDSSLKASPGWLKLFGCVVMLSGGALLGIVFSYLAALATAERLDETMGRRAGRMSGHVVLAGLGNLGYRVARLLTEQGMEVAVLEMSATARFADAVRSITPVLTGDARLPENLERASVRQAAAFLGCTNDDLSNIQACLHVRRVNPDATVIARVFDDALAERLADAFAIDRALSASQCAVGAFVGAATDERALRPLHVGSLSLIACRYTITLPFTKADMDAWRANGVRILAFRTPASPVQPPSDLTGALDPGDEIILCGPADAVRQIMANV
ncbi:MAG: TrkA-N domain protein [Capsulimonas sp.]|jgi:Trk K+ transport system NAD-binding subunit|nr:TrkA-N domain protein [Capsulimonas sp.]